MVIVETLGINIFGDIPADQAAGPPRPAVPKEMLDDWYHA
jgi:hypothetical protein